MFMGSVTVPRSFPPLRGFLIIVLGTLALDSDALLKISKVCCSLEHRLGSQCPSPQCCSGQVVVKPYVFFYLFVFEICKMETIALPALTVRLKGEPMSSLLHNRQLVNSTGWKCVLPVL